MVDPDADGPGRELLDRVARAVAAAQGDVEALLCEVALVLRHEPGGVAAAEGEVQSDRDLLGRARAVAGDQDHEDTDDERESGGHCMVSCTPRSRFRAERSRPPPPGASCPGAPDRA